MPEWSHIQRAAAMAVYAAAPATYDLPMRYFPLVLFAILYAIAVLAWDAPAAILVIYACVSLLCFGIYAFDKSAARAGRHRVAETKLLLLGLACGWPGALLAQEWLRHKSSKPSFRWRFQLTVALNLLAFAWLASPMRP